MKILIDTAFSDLIIKIFTSKMVTIITVEPISFKNVDLRPDFRVIELNHIDQREVSIDFFPVNFVPV